MIKNLDDVIALLETLPANDDPKALMGFDMNRDYLLRDDTLHPCGSACCLGGWVAFKNGLKNLPAEIAIKDLGIPYRDAYRLCFPMGVLDWEAITPQQAIRCIEIYQSEGVVDWPRAIKEVPND